MTSAMFSRVCVPAETGSSDDSASGERTRGTTGGLRVSQRRVEVRQAAAHSLGHVGHPGIRARLEGPGALLYRRGSPAEFVQRRFETTEKRRDSRDGLRTARDAVNRPSGFYEIATAVVKLVLSVASNRRTADRR